MKALGVTRSAVAVLDYTVGFFFLVAKFAIGSGELRHDLTTPTLGV